MLTVSEKATVGYITIGTLIATIAYTAWAADKEEPVWYIPAVILGAVTGYGVYTLVKN